MNRFKHHYHEGGSFRLGLDFEVQNVAGIVSSVVFKDQDAPIYKPALITVASCQAAFMVLCLFLRDTPGDSTENWTAVRLFMSAVGTRDQVTGMRCES